LIHINFFLLGSISRFSFQYVLAVSVSAIFAGASVGRCCKNAYTRHCCGCISIATGAAKIVTNV
jgi:hypothetical protein